MSRTAVYASEATIRRRVFERFAQDRADIERIAREVAVLRAAAYEGRLQEMADAVGLDREIALSDPDILQRLARDSRDVAAGIVTTHNADLRRWLEQQPRGVSQRDLAAAALVWLTVRAERKAGDIARTEGMTARNEAAVDVARKNGMRVRVRAEPRTAAEPKCAAIVAHGWYELDDAPHLPQHVRCIHAWVYSDNFTAGARSRSRVWMGDWEETGRP